MNDNNKSIFFITGNRNKFKEIQTLFKKEKLSYQLKQLNAKTTEIQAQNLHDVALFKLNSIREDVKDSYFIEDAGFFVDDPLNGFPGVYSKYVLNTIGNQGILRLIDNFPQTKAHFTTVIALYWKPFKETLLFEGKVEGKISDTIRGTGGFGFDPIFLPNVNPSKTFAELSIEEKNSISHRGKAWQQLVNFLKTQ